MRSSFFCSVLCCVLVVFGRLSYVSYLGLSMFVMLFDVFVIVHLTLVLMRLSLTCFFCCWEVFRCACVVRNSFTNCFVLWSTLLYLCLRLSTLFSFVSVRY